MHNKIEDLSIEVLIERHNEIFAQLSRELEKETGSGAIFICIRAAVMSALPIQMALLRKGSEGGFSALTLVLLNAKSFSLLSEFKDIAPLENLHTIIVNMLLCQKKTLEQEKEFFELMSKEYTTDMAFYECCGLSILYDYASSLLVETSFEERRKDQGDDECILRLRYHYEFLAHIEGCFLRDLSFIKDSQGFAQARELQGMLEVICGWILKIESKKPT